MAADAGLTNRLRRLITAAVMAALLWPALRETDGLPLSSYPMYAGARSDVVTIIVARGVVADGSYTSLSMPEIADTRDPLIAQSFLNDAVDGGRIEAVCVEIAERVSTNTTAVEIARETHNIVERAAGAASLLAREMLEHCAVTR